jgi:predicted MFS family arabinose efflux permease
LLAAAVTTLAMVAPFLPETLLGRPRSYNSVLNGILAMGMVLSVPAVTRAARRLSDLRLLEAAAAGGALVAWAALLAAASTSLKAVLLGGFFVFGGVMVSASSVPSLVLARLADASGGEGLLFGMNGLALNLGSGIGSAVTGFLLERGAKAPSGVRAALAGAGVAFASSACLFAYAARAEARRKADG